MNPIFCPMHGVQLTRTQTNIWMCSLPGHPAIANDTPGARARERHKLEMQSVAARQWSQAPQTHVLLAHVSAPTVQVPSLPLEKEEVEAQAREHAPSPRKMKRRLARLLMVLRVTLWLVVLVMLLALVYIASVEVQLYIEHFSR